MNFENLDKTRRNRQLKIWHRPNERGKKQLTCVSQICKLQKTKMIDNDG